MDLENYTGESYSEAAQNLRKLANNPAMELGLEPGPQGLASEQFDPAQGDKGLTFLAKRLYGKTLNPQDALSAALLLSAAFVEKMGPDPILKPGDRLTIHSDRAELMLRSGSSFRNVVVNFEPDATPEAAGVVENSKTELAQLKEELSGAPKTLTEQLKSIPNTMVLDEYKIGSVQVCRISVNNRYFGLSFNTKLGQYRLTQLEGKQDLRAVAGPTLVNWTPDFGRVKAQLDL